MAGSLDSKLLTALRTFVGSRGPAEELKRLLQKRTGQLHDATMTVGAEATNAIVVSIQLQDEDGEDLAVPASVIGILFADAAGAALNTVNYTIAAGTDGNVVELVADKVLLLTSEADGDIDLSLTVATGETCYLALLLPTGELKFSDAITHAA